VADAGNVFRSRMSVKLSLRVPPTADVHAVGDELRALLESDPPYGAKVGCATAPVARVGRPGVRTLARSCDGRCEPAHFGAPVASCGVGGTIPFMGMLGEPFPDAQFLLVGVLGPGSNAHGPDEFLDLPTARRVTACVADVLRAHAERDT
jgi:acetylornithine deacetylase/succinyl-diaminopimelate desuccinylase-like protein